MKQEMAAWQKEHQDKWNKVCDNFFNDVEKRIGRPMTESQKQGIHNSGTYMFLEVMMMGFDCAKTDEDVEKWLVEIDGFKRDPSQP